MNARQLKNCVQTIGSIFVLYKRNEKKPRIDIKVSK